MSRRGAGPAAGAQANAEPMAEVGALVVASHGRHCLIETADGRAEYARRQKEFADRASELRTRVIDALDGVLAKASSGD